MKYIGYILLLLSGVAGYLGVRVWFVYLKDTPQAPDQNMLMDGAYLFLGQLLIMFAIFLLGVFIASPGGGMFGEFLSGRQPGSSE